MDFLEKTFHRPEGPDFDDPVDLRRLEAGPAESQAVVLGGAAVKENIQRSSPVILIMASGYPGLEFHEAGPACLLDPLGHRFPQAKGRRPLLAGIGENAQMIEGGPPDELLEPLELLVTLTWETHDDRSPESDGGDRPPYLVYEPQRSRSAESSAH